MRVSVFIVNGIKQGKKAYKMLGTEKKIWWSDGEEKRNGIAEIVSKHWVACV